LSGGGNEKLFLAASALMKNSPVIRIGITGSYGKSSTKRILAHLLSEKFGAENVLTNPGNENNEIAIARQILKFPEFFGKNKKQKYFVCEIGAYKKGEIREVCEFLRPQVSILTGLNAQHVELFGSLEKIRAAKFELAESTTEKVFFNADTPALVEIFEDKKITATPIGITRSVLQNVVAEADRTKFEVFGKKFELPWAGEFFASNALLALEAAREIGCTTDELVKFLKELPPLERALHTRKMESGTTVLLDPYSANPDGVRGAIDHLAKFSGKKVFVGIPLRELGKNAEKEHEKIFEHLKKIGAEVWWLKSDFAKNGKQILGKNFHTDPKSLPKNLGKNDAVLLESRLPQEVEKKFTT
jgi:UDP-N-acetylmuramoyl-tripeptide--D-alanyl-D-alanine ligase